MNELIQTNEIAMKRDEDNLAYILNNSNLYHEIGYKVLQSQTDQGFVPCCKVIHNGKPKLVYDIAGYKTLENLMNHVTINQLMTIYMNLVEGFLSVKNNGFMKCENILLDLDKIFIDTNNFKVYLIYIPINNNSAYTANQYFLEELQSVFITSLQANKNAEASQMMYLRENLNKPIYDLDVLKNLLNEVHITEENSDFNNLADEGLVEQIKQESRRLEQTYYEPPKIDKQSKEITRADISGMENHFSEPLHTERITEAPKKKQGFFQKIMGKKQEEPKPILQQEPYQDMAEQIHSGNTQPLDIIFQPSISLVGMNTIKRVEFMITKPEFVIGKKADMVDGYIDFNHAISRTHCKILWYEGAYYLIDLESANGTFVNQVRIAPMQSMEIQVGDIVRMADNDFLVKSIQED